MTICAARAASHRYGYRWLVFFMKKICRISKSGAICPLKTNTTIAVGKTRDNTHAVRIRPGQFEPHNHWYPKALNATINPVVGFFLNLSRHRIIRRYCHLHPRVNEEVLNQLLQYQPRYFRWAGADLMHVTDAAGNRKMVLIETNSCPSGQKSMPLTDDNQEQGGYRLLVEHTIKPLITKSKRLPAGKIAVVYDKNPMEASGYACALADALQTEVLYAPWYDGMPDPPVRYRDGQMYVRDPEGEWQPIAFAFRYLTQRPWNRLCLHSRTAVLNPAVACLAGGRNKMVAAKAYDFLNGELQGTGIEILTPETIWDVSKAEIPLWVRKMGGQAVIKIPYSNAGQGVFTIVNEEELARFMQMDFPYDQFIVQSLIGNYSWSSVTRRGRLYHVGTMPNLRGETYVADLRMMVCATAQGLRPLCIYARRARMPLARQLEAGQDSWAMLGTNLSVKNPDGSWGSDTNRLLLMDRRDFNRLGIGLDDLIDAYIQTVLATIAIDKMCEMLFTQKKKFRMRLFQSLNQDPALIREICVQ